MNKYKLLLLWLAGVGSALVGSSADAAIDISTQITTFTGSVEDYAEAAIPAVFAIIAVYFLYRLIKRFTK